MQGTLARAQTERKKVEEALSTVRADLKKAEKALSAEQAERKKADCWQELKILKSLQILSILMRIHPRRKALSRLVLMAAASLLRF